MKIQKNTNIQDVYLNQDNTMQTDKIKNKSRDSVKMLSVNGASFMGESLVEQRKLIAKKQALKVVEDAFKGEKKLDSQMQAIKDEIKHLQEEINEKTAESVDYDKKLRELQVEYGIEPDNKNCFSDMSSLSDEEREKMTEYQEKAAFYTAMSQRNSNDINKAKALQAANVQGYADIKRERSKSQDMIKAQDAAEDIMEAANGETIALLTQEAVEHIDEEQKEREKEAKEAAERKKEEKKEEAKKLEKEALRQEMIENIKEHSDLNQKTASDTKRAIARRERAEADRMEFEDVDHTVISDAASVEDTQEAVNAEITNILNKLSLLSSDVKGSAVDSQI